MTAFEVWAPNARRVELQIGDRRIPLTSQEDRAGWFGAALRPGERTRPADGPRPGDDHFVILDAGGPLPDPRSAWQPKGPDGPSRAYDHARFDWTDADWKGFDLTASVLYELHVGTFTPDGTFDAIVEQLPHLVELGVDAIELMPVAEFPGNRGWGYDGVNLFAPHHAYGGPDALKRLVDACHRSGLGVILDVVYNHVGPTGNHLARFGPYFSTRHTTPWGPAINFDGPDSDEVREFVCENAIMWLRDYHFDGLRIDAVHAIVDTSARHILEEIAERVRALEQELDRKLWVIAESDLNDPHLVWDPPTGYGVDAQWSDDFHHALHCVLTGESVGYYRDFGTIADLATALQQAFVYTGQHSSYRRRRHGRFPSDLSGHRFLGYLQNHDQIGNRPRGERVSVLVSDDLVKVGAALVLTSPFVALLFQGEEWNATPPFSYFSDHDAAAGHATREGRKRELAAFGWADEPFDPQSPATHEGCKLDWSELEDPRHADVFDWYKQLIRLRREEPALRDGRLDRVRTQFSEEDKWLVVERGPITVAANFSASPVSIPIASSRRRELLLTSSKDPETDGDAIRLPPESVTICRS